MLIELPELSGIWIDITDSLRVAIECENDEGYRVRLWADGVLAVELTGRYDEARKFAEQLVQAVNDARRQ